MSPIEAQIGDRTETYKHDELLTIGRWSKVLGISDQAVLNAAIRANIEIQDEYTSNGVRRSFPVSEFPRLIEGFKMTPLRKNKGHYHPWSENVETDSDKFEVNIPGYIKTTIVYSETEE